MIVMISKEVLEICEKYGLHGKTLEIIEDINKAFNEKMNAVEHESDNESSGGLCCCDISDATFLDWIEMTASKNDEYFSDMTDGERFMYALGLLAYGVL